MHLVVPMAGKGTRLRPHTHTTPKPLLPIAGKSMIERILETFAAVLPERIATVGFVLGDFGPEVTRELRAICDRLGFEARFYRQERPEGTGHAVYMAAELLAGPVLVAFADTLFELDHAPHFEAEAVVWTCEVQDPRRFGVVLEREGRITDFVEKPSTPISNKAIVGIYYFREGAHLRRALERLIAEDRRGYGGELQLTDALDDLLKQGLHFATSSVSAWLDCGTVADTLRSTFYFLERLGRSVDPAAAVERSVLIEPVYVGPGAVISRSVVGPYVSVEAGARLEDAIVRRSIVNRRAELVRVALEESFIGQHARLRGLSGRFNVGDHSAAEGA
ncbi:MAG: sugar phosphate nucleotidyltransferase [Bacteroidetes bacterium]|nr:sugar phosphate nucleotidyltransferase [Rhodothermia bacterium]MCS7155013.1 sugar phosphate nucleotidyltransferase [Bacteroidota bacterium]MCX7907297.1 sugar phosphate nucleotidyltransferase [Bacteroidota bacterium]MDW8137976.1 sugar phosphate nucleotidyltransferase [Bacteroidota bacterium]MDW8286172.1 sugar phosphate nucleotidyltransferase [Bacteroidota bacterium]